MSQPSWGKWGSWEETETYLDTVIGVVEGPDAVEKGSIRRWLEPKEFDCPLHYDEKVAYDAGYDGIIAPGVMAITYGVDAYWKPGDPPAQPGDAPTQISIPVIHDVPAPCTLSFATSVSVEFFRPIELGDRITLTSKLVKIQRKTLRVGDGAFLTQEDTYTNQDGEKLAVVLLDIFRFSPPEGSDDPGTEKGQ